MVEVGRQVDIPPQARFAYDSQREAESPCLRSVAPERARAVAELEARSARDARDVGAVVAAVGHEGDAVVTGRPGEVDRERQVGVRDDDAIDVERGERGHAVVHRTVQPSTRAPHDFRAGGSRPVGNFVVIADDEDREGMAGCDHAVRHASSKRDARLSAQRGSETHLRVTEALDGHEHGCAHRGESMVTRMPIRRAVGVLGTIERAEVDERGAVSACDGAWRLDWSVVEASGRWRNPATDTSTRQVAVSSSPVFETSVRVAGGDIRHRVYAIFESGALAVVEVENDSPEPVAIAFAVDGDGPPLVSPRAAPIVPAMPALDGPPANATIFPLPHRAVIRVGIPLGAVPARWPDRVPTAAQVAAGWTRMAEHSERIDAPGALPGTFAFARAQLLLVSGPDPAAFLLAAGARWRLARESIDVTAADIGSAAQLVAQRVRSGATTLDHGALVEARELLAASGDALGAGDVEARP